MEPDDLGLRRLNALGEQEAADALRACCSAPAWVRGMLAARPFPERSALLARSAAELDQLDWAGIRQALDAHPRIGERVAGADTEAQWSRREQSGMDGASDQ